MVDACVDGWVVDGRVYAWVCVRVCEWTDEWVYVWVDG